jgi:hypothetical protein
VIAGLPWQTWLLLIVAAGTGLVVALRFWLAHRR